MAAQSGDALVLSYGTQGNRQGGDALVLDASQTFARTLAAATRALWRTSAEENVVLRAPHAPAQDESRPVSVDWAGGSPLDAKDRAEWEISAPADNRAKVPWGRYTGRAQPQSDARWAVSASRDRRSAAPWGQFSGRAAPDIAGPWPISVRRDEAAGAPWSGPMVFVELDRAAVYARGAAADRTERAPWNKFARVLQPGWGIVVPAPDPNAPPEALYIVPVKKVYMVLNTVSLSRVDNDTAIPATGFTVKLEDGSWVWSFTASIPGSAQSLVESSDGTAVELEANVNGTLFRLLVESIGRERAFKQNDVSISGRGKAALLDAPWCDILTLNNAGAARNAQQLAGEALAATTFGAGWALNWGITDWLVPAGVWSFAGTQIGALNAIAGAAGAFIQPHTSDLSLSVLARYPVGPWDWAAQAPDYELPSDVVTREGIQWSGKPGYNRVFISGTQQGRLGQVTRSGSAGDRVAQMVTDALITDAAVSRMRGLAVLSTSRGIDTDKRRMATVALRLPVLPETGVILPGKFVRYVDGGTTYIGMSRSTQLDVAMPGVWQTIGVEIHVD